MGELKMKEEFKIVDIPSNGIHMGIEVFLNNVFDSVYTDDKGTGYYATKKGMSNLIFKPSDILKGNFDKKFIFSSAVWIPKNV